MMMGFLSKFREKTKRLTLPLLLAAAGGVGVAGRAAAAVPLELDGTIPAAAMNAGSGGTSWGTDVFLTNVGSTPGQVTLYAGNVATPARAGEFVVAYLEPGETERLTNIMAGFPDVEPPAALFYDVEGVDPGQVVVMSRTYTPRPGGAPGTMGQGVPGVALTALPAGVPHYVPLAEDVAVFRTNVGIVNANPEAADFTTTIHASGGVVQGADTITLPAYSWFQYNDIFAKLGVSPHAGWYATVAPTDVNNDFFTVYSSIVDNRTGDPTYFASQWRKEASGINHPEIIVPAVAKLDGANGTTWQSTVTAGALGTVDVLAHFAYWLEGEENFTNPAMVASFALGSGELITRPDFVTNDLHMAGTKGALYTAPSESFNVWSRTFNTGADGTYGQGLPGLEITLNAILGENKGVITGLRQSTDTQQGFRSNIGVVSTNPHTTTLSIALYENDALVKTIEQTILPGEMLQFNNIYQGLGEITNGHAVITAHSDVNVGGIIAYGSVVDNQSGDPTTILAKRVGSEPVVEPEYEMTARLVYTGPENQSWYSEGTTQDQAVIHAIFGDRDLSDYVGTGTSWWNTNERRDELNQIITDLYTNFSPDQIEDTFGDAFGDTWDPYFSNAMDDADGDGWRIDTMTNNVDWEYDNSTAHPENDPNGAVRAIEVLDIRELP